MEGPGSKSTCKNIFLIKALYTSADILVNKEISEGTNFLSFLGIPERFWRIPSQDVHHSRYIKVIKVHKLFKRNKRENFFCICNMLHLPGGFTILTTYATMLLFREIRPQPDTRSLIYNKRWKSWKKCFLLKQSFCIFFIWRPFNGSTSCSRGGIK